MQALLDHRSGQSLRLIIFSVLALSLSYIDYKSNKLRNIKSHIASVIIEPINMLASLPANALISLKGASHSRHKLQEENRVLKAQNQHLQSQQLQLEGLIKENQRLRELLNSSKNLSTESTIAEILAIDLDPFKQIITLNKGLQHNIEAGQAVIDGFGVMGQITRSQQNSATVLLISDPNHTLPVQLERNGLRTLANGTGQADSLKLLYVPTNADIQVGDLVITSGLGGTFPKNYPVATITEIKIEPGRHFMQVTAKPNAKLNRSREVLVLRNIEYTSRNAP